MTGAGRFRRPSRPPRPAHSNSPGAHTLRCNGPVQWKRPFELGECEGGPLKWIVREGYFEVAPGSGDIRTKQAFGDCQLHVEWAAPNPPRGKDQDRGNSGIFLMGLYEMQVLDTYKSPTYADGMAGAVYGQWPPLVNATLRPGEWQTYGHRVSRAAICGRRNVNPACNGHAAA